MRDRVRIVWADGRTDWTECGGLARDLIMPVPVPNSGGAWRPVPFVREVIEMPDNWHGPFESAYWFNGDVGRYKMVVYREAS